MEKEEGKKRLEKIVREVVTPEIMKMLIGEGLIMTHDIWKVAQHLNTYMGKKWHVMMYEKDGSIILSPKTEDKNLDYIIKYLDNMGYYLADFYSPNLGFLGGKYKGDDWTHVEFNAKYDMEYHPNNEFVYHVTDAKYVPKILKNGLIPKSKNKMNPHPDRIYLTDNIESLNAITNEFVIGGYIENPVQLKISCRRLYIKYMSDPKFNGGFYTTQNIPPQNIEIFNQK